MRVTAVESRMIYAVGYDAAKREMEVFFHSGGVYRYKEVDPGVYQELLEAESKGRYMHENILGKYEDYHVSG